MKPLFLPEAEQEAIEAALWYEAEKRGLGWEFLAKLELAVDAIGDAPGKFSFYEAMPNNQRFRRVVLERFPYVVIYEAQPDETLVVAVAHTARRPGYWLERTPHA